MYYTTSNVRAKDHDLMFVHSYLTKVKAKVKEVYLYENVQFTIDNSYVDIYNA